MLLKRGDENNGKQGRDWLSNFDFDRDVDYSNNRLDWLNIGPGPATLASFDAAHGIGATSLVGHHPNAAACRARAGTKRPTFFSPSFQNFSREILLGPA